MFDRQSRGSDPLRPITVARTVFPAMALLFQLAGDVLAQEKESPEDGSNEAPTVKEVTPTEAQQRELDASEDPLKAEQQERKIERAEEAAKPEAAKKRPEAEKRTTGFDLYGSLRVRYRDTNDSDEWEDGGSRAGVKIDWRLTEQTYLYGRYEAGFSILTGIDDLTNPGDRTEEFEDTVFTRLWYAGIESPAISAIAGKSWSTYYQVAGFTDRFQGTGGSASGAFNAQTDGGPTGPGRADSVLQTQGLIDFLPQKHFKPFKLNFQVQYGNDIPFGDGARYGAAFGLSAILETNTNLKIGLAYNHADVDLKEYPSLRKIGLNGHANAALFGIRSFGDKWYAGLTLSRLANHETTDDGIYFDGVGSEFYGQYQIRNRLWFVGGFNYLKPDKDQRLARDYKIQYSVLGLRFSFDGFTRMIWANVRFDNSVNADGTPGSNVYTLGVRWDLSKRGWHLTN
jgi:predicted porin